MRSSLPQLELDSPTSLAAPSPGRSVATLPYGQTHNRRELALSALHQCPEPTRSYHQYRIALLLSTGPLSYTSTYHPFNPHSTAV